MGASLRILERELFKLFFSRLAREANSDLLYAPTLDQRFRKFYKTLSEVGPESESMKRLLGILRPDPITGSATALHRNLLTLQPGIVSMPNFTYERPDVLPGEHGKESLLCEALGESFSEAFDRAIRSCISADVSGTADVGS